MNSVLITVVVILVVSAIGLGIYFVVKGASAEPLTIIGWRQCSETNGPCISKCSLFKPNGQRDLSCQPRNQPQLPSCTQPCKENQYF